MSINLEELGQACEWTGINSRLMDGRLMFFKPSGELSAYWDGVLENGWVAFLLRDAIEAKAKELAAGTPSIINMGPTTALSIFSGFRLSRLTTVGAAECLINMWKAAQA